MFDAAEFLACHGMAWEDTLGGLRTEESTRPLDESLFCASSIGDQSGGRDERRDGFQLRQNAAHGSGEDDHIAAHDRLLQIGFRPIDRATRRGDV